MWVYNSCWFTAVLVTRITHNCHMHTRLSCPQTHFYTTHTEAVSVSSITEVMQRGLSSLLLACLLNFVCVCVCFVHQLLCSRLIAASLLGFHTKSCRSIICCIHSLTSLPFFSCLVLASFFVCLLPLLLWLVPPSKGPAEPVKPRQEASEWDGKDGEGPQRLESPLELPACGRNQYKTQNLHSSEWGFLCFKVFSLRGQQTSKGQARRCSLSCSPYWTPVLISTGCVWFC